MQIIKPLHWLCHIFDDDDDDVQDNDDDDDNNNQKNLFTGCITFLFVCHRTLLLHHLGWI